MSHKFRCAICNKVDSKDIQTNAGDYSTHRFYPDPKDKNFSVCTECKETHEELMLDYELEDDVYGWYGDEVVYDDDQDKV